MKLYKIFRLVCRSITLLRLFGVPVQFHTSWFVFPGGLLVLSGILLGGWAGLFLGLCFLGIVTGSILFHEFAHVLAARQCGCRTRRVWMLPFACVAELEAIPLGVAEIWMAAAGPLASLLLSGVFWLAAQAIPAHSLALWKAHRILTLISFLNFGLACFNLLPCFPMDGGRIFRSLLAVLIGLFRPTRYDSALILATRIAVRYVARTIVVGMVLLTISYTHLWHHILIFGLLALAGEAEFLLLREELGAAPNPVELLFLPVAGQPLSKPATSPACRMLP